MTEDHSRRSEFIRLGALTAALLLTIFLAFGRYGWRSVPAPAAPLGLSSAVPSPVDSTVSARRKVRRQAAAVYAAKPGDKSVEPAKLSAPMRGARLDEKGEALGGDAGERQEAREEKKEAQAEADKEARDDAAQ